MKINKSLNIDLNIISPQKHIRIHEGDVDSVDILIGVTVDDESVVLDGLTIKYDATINNYLAEQDADGSIVDGKITIPVTQNMTAMSGLLLIDVRMIQDDQILYTQTIYVTVEKAVVNGSTYIDFDKITIIQRMNALEKQMEHVEEIVENFDTSKLIVSTNRPPSGAPPEIDVDLLRVGDTWILSGENIVYKLVEAQYNYQPAPGTEPYHKFTWKPLNERHGVGNTEPPTSVTYQAVIYTINEVQWSWLPVPEYFKGDHYQMLVDGESTYFVCRSSNLVSYTGVCTYTWREEGGSVDAYTKAETNELLADKMDLAPLNPTAEQIAAMPSGQLYGNKIAQTEFDEALFFKLPQDFYYEGDLKFYSARSSDYRYPIMYKDTAWRPLLDTSIKKGSLWFKSINKGEFYILSKNDGTENGLEWQKVNNQVDILNSLPIRSVMTYRSDPYIYGISGYEIPPYCVNDLVIIVNNGQMALYKLASWTKTYDSETGKYYAEYNWQEKSRVYTKAEIDTKIGDIGTAIDTLNGNIDTLNTNLSEV